MAGRCTHEAASIDQGPRSHRDHDGIRLDDAAIDVNACYPRSIRTSDHPCDLPRAQFGAVTLRCAHDRRREFAWVNNRGRFRRAESMRDKYALASQSSLAGA